MPADSQPRPFRFGVQARLAQSRAQWGELARRAEGLGYSSLTMPDHLDGQLGPIAGLMAAADATTRLRIGHLVLANDYRHPAILAKELATLDLLSDGRLDLALGAGHDENDYRAIGLTFDRPGERIERLEEALDVIYGLFGREPFSYAGKHYRVRKLDGQPKPAQPRVPLLIGAGGPRMLRLAARRADIIGVNGTMRPGPVSPGVLASGLPIPRISHASWLSMSAEHADAKVALIRRSAGARMARIELSVRAFLTQVTSRLGALEEQLARELEVDRQFVRTSPFILAGSVARIAETLHERRERWGITHVVVGAAEMDSFAPVLEAVR
jgi:probable F420-dependent oxidoreductase